MLIRAPRAGEAEQMAEAHVQGWRAGCAGILPEAYLAELDVSASVARWTGKLANPHPATDDLVAEVGGRVVGLASFGRSYDPELPRTPPPDVPLVTGELHLLYVHPDHWGTGAGSRLHDAALAALVDAGFRDARLWVVRGNNRAVAFYGRRGWTRDGPTRTMTDAGASWVEERMIRAATRGDSDPAGR